MAIIKKFSPKLNLSAYNVFVTDTLPTSQYFRVTQFNETFTGGKNGFLIEGSEYLKEGTEVKIEILDVEGNPIYFEPGDGIPEYYEGTSKLVSVHVYEDTPIGIGKITILGEAKEFIDENGATQPIPSDWENLYNVKWERDFTINKNLPNESIVRFYKRPLVTISELTKPIFTKSVPTVTDTGHVHGIAEVPPSGTDLSVWRAGTFYKLKKTSGSWDRDVDENVITITSPAHSGRIIEVLNDTEVLIDTPYTIDNIVSNFTSGSFSVTYSDFQNQVIGDTALTGSFAKIDITQLKTFVGDVARVKVFRKSRNAVGDFQFVQESKLESSELLRDITTTSDTELSYGRFDESNLSTYWETSSNDHGVSIDSSVLSQAVKFDYDTVAGGVQQLITSASFSLSKDVEYTLNFKTILSGSTTTDKSIRAFFSSSNFTQDFLTVSGSSIYKTRQDVSKNIISENTGDAKLVFEVKGDDWYISNASLKNAQDTSFSPDEFTLIQDIPRKTVSETFDFRFEFYDINNNYIPVDVTAEGTFSGGNDFPSSTKLLTFESDRNAFRFSSGSTQNPSGQQIQFKLSNNNLTGSVTYASSAFDVDGNYLDPSDYSQYPGKLTSVTNAGAIITINNFTGSRTDGLPTPFVGSIVYTASLEDKEEFETVYRLEDGDNAPQLVVTSNANQFIYEPTTLSAKPSGQSITIRAQRKNLASLITPITVNSGSNTPELILSSTENGVDTYTISATQFSASFADNNFEEVTYSFTGSDVFGNEQVDEITISKVINFDGISVVLSNESTSFPAKSTGEVLGGFVASSGSVQMFIGSNEITHDDVTGDGVRNRNTFDIKTITESNVTATSTSPTTKNYSISAFETGKDSGSLTLDIEYLAGDNSTSQSFQKIVSYTKAKKAVPSVLTKTSPSTQTINSSSTEMEAPQNVEVIVQEGGDEYTYDDTLGTGGGDADALKFRILSISSGSQVGATQFITPTTQSNANYNGTIGSASIAYVDSEGTYISDKIVRFDVSVSKIGVDGLTATNTGLTFSDNSISYNADGDNPDPSTVTIIVSASNFTTPEFKITGGGSFFTDETTYSVGNHLTDVYTASFTPPSTYQSTPLTFTADVREQGNASRSSSDRESIIFVKPGLDISPRFIIKPINGTQIKNSDGSLELQVVKLDGSGSSDISGSGQGDAQIYSGSNILSTSMTGITAGSNGVTYNPVIDSSAIYGTKELLLKETDGTILDSITLLDVTDGIGGGSFLTNNGLITRRLTTNLFSPTSLAATASFFDPNGNEFSSSVLITPNWNGTLDQMKVSSAAGDTSEITITANDGDGNSITLGDSNYTNTKDINLVATFTDPITNRTNTISETFFIISEGRDGTSARFVRLSADNQVFTVAVDGTISPSQITLTGTKQNISGSLTFNTSNSVSLGGSGDTRTIASSEFDSLSSSTISITGSEDGEDFFDEMTIVKLTDGSNGITVVNSNQSHTLPASSSGEVLDYANSGTTIKVFEGADELTYDGSGTTAGNWTVTTSQSPNALTIGTITDNGDNITVGNHSAMHEDSGSTQITYAITGQRQNGFAFSIDTTQSITKALEGLDAITVTNSNQAHSFTADVDGNISSYTGGGTSIQVFEGGTALTFTTGTAGNGEYTISIGDTSDITEGTASGNGTTTATISAPSAMVVSAAIITYTISGKRLNGDSFTRTTSQSFTKAIAGAAGSNANAISLTASQYAVLYDGAGTKTAVSITLTADAQNFTSPQYRFLENGVERQTWSTTNTYTIPDAQEAAANTADTWKAEVREGGSGTYDAFDSVNIFGVQDGTNGTNGSDAYTVILTNEAHTLPTTTGGTVTYTGSGTSIVVYKGATELNGITSGTPTTGQFKVTATGTDITVGSQTSTGNPVVFADHSSMTANTAKISYSINIEDDVTITKEQSFAKSLQGSTGPTGPTGAGVVYRGEYSSSETYFHTSQRRDVVKYSSNYYLTDNTAKSGLTTWGTPTGADWEAFGAQFSSVATDILFANDVYANRTVNVGASGSTPVIALNADAGNSYANPYIGLNATSYNSNGIYLGYDGGTAKFSIKSASNSLLWNGSTLSLTGAVTATSGNIGGWTISSTQLTGGSGATTIGLIPGTGIHMGDAVFADSPLKITNAGAITATSGTIGGWTLGSGAFTSSNTSLFSSQTSPNGRGLYITDGSKNRIIVSDLTAFQTSVSLSSGGTTSTASPSSILRSGAIYNNNTAAEATNGTFTSTVSFSVTPGQEISISANNANLIASGTGGTNYLDVTGGTGTTFALTWHYIYFKVSGAGLNTSQLIANGSMHYYSGAYHRNMSSTGASVVAASSGTVTVTLEHKVGIDYLGTGQQIHLKPAPISSRTISKGDAPQTVEICQAGIQAFYGSNVFKVNTNAGSSTFVDIDGDVNIDGQLDIGGGVTADTATISSITIGELSLSSTQLTLPGSLRVTGEIYALATSDRRLKDNLTIIKNPLIKLSKINGYEFDWNSNHLDRFGHDYGVVAQEVEEILPEIIDENQDGYKKVDYIKLIPLLIESIKEQQNQINDLKEIIKRLT